MVRFWLILPFYRLTTLALISSGCVLLLPPLKKPASVNVRTPQSSQTFCKFLPVSTDFRYQMRICVHDFHLYTVIRSLEQRHAFTRDVNFTIGQKSELFRPRGSADTGKSTKSGPQRGCQGSPSAVFPSSRLSVLKQS